MRELATRFDAVVANLWDPYPAATPESIAYIENRLAFTLPASIVDFARNSCSFSSFFLSLGPDFNNHSHIVAKNSDIRRHPDWLSAGPSAPEALVFISENFMADHFWCFDTKEPGPEYPVVYWAPDIGVGKQHHASFSALVSYVIACQERAVRK